MKYYTGECYICDGKIAFIIEDNDIFYFQIGHIAQNESIITEYYIDSNSVFDSILIKNVFNTGSFENFLKEVYKDKNNNSFILPNEKK